MAEEAKEEEAEYESDPEETKLALQMRRWETSDDEEEGGGNLEGRRRRETFMPCRRVVDSDAQSDGQGAAAEYENEEEDYDEEEVELIDGDDYAEEDDEYGGERRAKIGEVGAVGKEAEAQVGEQKESGEDRVEQKSIEALQGSKDDVFLEMVETRFKKGRR